MEAAFKARLARADDPEKLKGEVQAAQRRDGLQAGVAHTGPSVPRSTDASGARRVQLLELFEEVRAPARSAHLFSIEEIIDPRDTRPLASEWIELAYTKLGGEALGPRTAGLGFRP